MQQHPRQLATFPAFAMGSALYTYGSCRVGDESIAQAMQTVSHNRFVDCCDLVTRVPTKEFGYVHVGSLRYIDRNRQLLEPPSEDAINADRLKAAAWYLARHSFLPGTVFARDLAGHAPINYVSGVMDLRSA